MPPKKLLIFFGSPRERGASAQMLDIFLESIEAWECDIINPKFLNIAPCKDCRFCWENNSCVINDDMQPLYEKIDKADAFLIVSPVYFFSLPGSLKILIDRLQPYWVARTLWEKKPQKRVGALLLTGGASSHEGQFFHSEALVKGVFRELGAQYLGMVTYPQTDTQELSHEIRVNILNLAKKFL